MNKTAVLFVVLGVLTAAALMVLLKPEDASKPPFPPPAQATPAAPASEPAPAAKLEPVAQTYEWQIAEGKRISGPGTVQVRQGESLVLRFTSDHADELHLHGYDLSLKLKAGEQASLTLQAGHSGRFEMELHHAQLELAVLEVLPQ